MRSIRINRIVSAATSVIMGIASAFFPIWVISMKAPFLQYPLTIGIYPFQGIVGDLKNLNIVNHYVGLGEIHPENIPELAFIPLLYVAYIILIAAISLINGRKNRLFYVLFGVFMFLLISLPVYAYMWMYNYTHDVDPHAPIKLEPFDPPFFGIYKLANFNITSYLGLGFFLPLAAALLQLVINIRSKRRKESWR